MPRETDREEDRDRGEKTPLVHDIVRDIIRGDTSPYISKDGGIRMVMRDLYYLDLETLKFLHRIHRTEAEKPKQ